MDVSILRAAVSAAVRVTISTSVIGCGGSAIGDAGSAAGAPSDRTPMGGATSSDAGARPSAGTAGSEPWSGGAAVTQAGTASGGLSSGGAGTGGMASGGATSADGGASEANAGGGGDGAAGAPGTSACGAEVAACLDTLAQADVEQPFTPIELACCQTVIDGLTELSNPSEPAECFLTLNTTFMRSAARGVCCADAETWEQRACTPWGPPVPPELPLALLRAWEAAA